MQAASGMHCDAMGKVDDPWLGELVWGPVGFEELKTISIDPFDLDYPTDLDSDGTTRLTTLIVRPFGSPKHTRRDTALR